MGNSTRILALLVFGIIALSFLLMVRIQAPPQELNVLRSMMSQWQEQLSAEMPAPFANAVLISAPTNCQLDDKPEFLAEDLYTEFLESNREGASPIRLGSLTDLVSVVSFQESRRWQGFAHMVDVNPRALVELSRVAILEDEALVCVSNRYMGRLYRLEAEGSQWTIVESHRAWIS